MKKLSYKKVYIPWVLPGILIFFMVAAAADNVSAQEKKWDYVVLGDSQSRYLFPRYAKILEQDLGVKINIINRITGGQLSSTLLGKLREDQDLQDVLRKAKYSCQPMIFTRPRKETIFWRNYFGNSGINTHLRDLGEYLACLKSLDLLQDCGEKKIPD